LPEPGAVEPVIVRVPWLHPDAQRLVAEVQQEYVARYGGPDETPLDPAYFEPPAGHFFVATVAGDPAATGALRFRDDVEVWGTRAVAEVKRMYVVPWARGRGLARLMLARLEQTAREGGAEVVVLETGIRQPEALALYASAGYEPIPKFGFYRDSDLSRCLARRLPSLPD
jgi:GNAT superfamily N-acetyltransferase